MKDTLLVVSTERQASAISQQLLNVKVVALCQSLLAQQFELIVVLAPLVAASVYEQAAIDSWHNTALLTCLAPDGQIVYIGGDEQIDHIPDPPVGDIT